MKSFYITGTIWSGFYLDWLNQTIDSLATGEKLTVYINSPGGSLFEGIAMYNVLSQMPEKPIINIIGLAGSIASVVAMAGTVEMADTSMLFLHNLGYDGLNDWVNSDDLKKLADDLDKLKITIVRAYMHKTGLSEQEIISILDSESFLTADEALKLGFVDKIYTPDQNQLKNYMRIAAKIPQSKIINLLNNQDNSMNFEDLQKEHNILQAKYNSVQTDITGLHKEKEALNLKISELSAQLSLAVTEKTEMQSVIHNLNNKVWESEARLLVEKYVAEAKLKRSDAEPKIAKLLMLRSIDNKGEELYKAELKEIESLIPMLNKDKISTDGLDAVADEYSDLDKKVDEYNKGVK